jgi:uncharacterized protein YdaU (DUF1376 family)
MSKSPAFQFYADDFLAGTMDMSAAEVGAFMRLLCHQWNRGGLPNDIERLQKMAGAKVSDMVLEKFQRSEADGLIRNVRLEAERDKQNEYREKQRAKGLMSGVARRTAVEQRLNHGSGSVEPEANQNLFPVEQRLNSPSPSPSPKENICPNGPKKRFEKPTVQDLEAWFKSNGLPASEASRFFDYYEGKGWVVGKAPMKNWQATCRNWKRNFEERNGVSTKPSQALSEAEILKQVIG